MMQWSNLTKCGLFFNIVSPAVHTLFPSVLQCLDSCGIEALILILKKVLNCRYDFIIGPKLLPSQVGFFFILGNRKQSNGAKSEEYGGWSTSSKPQCMHSNHCNHRIVCRSIVLVKQDSLKSIFQAVLKCL